MRAIPHLLFFILAAGVTFAGSPDHRGIAFLFFGSITALVIILLYEAIIITAITFEKLRSLFYRRRKCSPNQDGLK